MSLFFVAPEQRTVAWRRHALRRARESSCHQVVEDLSDSRAKYLKEMPDLPHGSLVTGLKGPSLHDIDRSLLR